MRFCALLPLCCPVSDAVLSSQAVLYYQRAAHQGHPMAQYRYAKWLLRSWPKVEEDSSVQEAVDLLGQAAAAGLTQVTTWY